MSDGYTDGTEQEEVPRTDICEECNREIVAEVETVTGKHELIHAARESDEGFMPVTGGTAEIVFSCRCSHMRVEYGPGSTSAWKVPDEWMWEDEIDVAEDDGPEIRTDGGESVAGAERSYSGRFGFKCECGRTISIYDRRFHRSVVCPVHSGTEHGGDR